MKFLKATPTHIQEAAQAIRAGDIVAFPTETVYGLGADVFNPVACAKIFEAKQRPQFDPLIVHVESPTQVEKLASTISPRVKILIDKFWPGPLTLILPKRLEVPSIVTAGLDTVAVRMPSHPIAIALIKAAGTPIAAPSANPFGYLSPTTAKHVRNQLGDRVSIILNGGACPIGVESTIIKMGDPPVLLRPGGLPLEDIEQEIGKLAIANPVASAPEAPGQLKTHYSPRTPFILARPSTPLPRGKNIGYLSFKKPTHKLPVTKLEVLSETGDLREAAANLFTCLHRLDEAGVDIIVAETVPEEGLGRAIMNRLYKAASQ
ncbi:MAG: threonylcarbamoyl-AMP synthase [Chloroflexi bacterium RBG_13_48_10]|nr:MAG: threonylcarbamoyl-AMP synthase [Chloroflexi bacterium RBG_13_48_10]